MSNNSEIAQTLRDLIKRMISPSGPAQLLKAHENIAGPTTISEADIMSSIYVDLAAMSITYSLLFHIHDHGGDCAEDLLQYQLDRMKRKVITDVAEGCSVCDLQNPWDVSSVNAALVKEMLSACTKDNK